VGTKWNASLAVACLLLAGGGFGFGSWYQAHHEITATVTYQGARHTVTLQDGDSVGTALAMARVQPKPGALRAVVSHKVLDPNYAPAQVTMSAEPVSLSTSVPDHAAIDVEPGLDAVEPVTTSEEPVGAVETVGVLGFVDIPGKPARVVVTRGERSGEELRRSSLQPAMSPARRTDKVVTLTFDDGPSQYTAKVLDVLRQKGVKAVFCVIGRMIPDTPDAIRRIAGDGHALCDHTQNHDEFLDRKPQATIDAEMDQALLSIAVAGGPRPIFYRPPGGTLNLQILATANARHLQELHWSIDTGDWQRPGVDKIVARGTAVSPGAIVLMHDGGGDRGQTVTALPTIIDRLRAMGYSFVIPESTLPGAGPAVNPPLPPASTPPSPPTLPTTRIDPSRPPTTLHGD